MRSIIHSGLLILALLFAGASAIAQDQESPEEALTRWDKEATRAAGVIERGEASPASLDILREVLNEQRSGARALEASLSDSSKPTRRQLEELGPVPEEGEPDEVAAVREELTKGIEGIVAQEKRAALAAARADELIGELDELSRTNFANQLLTRGPSPLSPPNWPKTIVEVSGAVDRVGGELSDLTSDPIKKRQLADRGPTILLALALGLLIGWIVRRRLVDVARGLAGPDVSRARHLFADVLAIASRLILPAFAALLLFGTLWRSGLVDYHSAFLLRGLTGAVAMIITAYAIGYAFFAPDAPELRLAKLDEKRARRAARLSLWMGGAVAADHVVRHTADGLRLSAESLAVLNLPILVVGSVAIWRLTTILKSQPGGGDTTATQDQSAETSSLTTGPQIRRGLLFLARAAAVLAPLLAIAGYYAASRQILVPVIFTAGLIGGGLLLFAFVTECVRTFVGGDDDGGDKLSLLPVLVGFLLICAAVPLFALVWGASGSDLREAWAMATDGVSFGDVRISPLDFVTFVLVFALFYMATRVLQNILNNTVLPRTRLDSGGRTAITSGVGYVGFFLAALAAISAAGLDLSNLAIVAGALSVGIGFGLQTIVSNFVSGVILLVERPIKTGDWIEVNGVHGTVRQINVRATEVETFDRSTLIVPNSDLIAGSVVNWTHSNNIGRIIVPVGVEYDTDPRKVEEILKEIAAEQEMLLKYPAPTVLFVNFGADALEFELRAFLRDVNWIMSVRSAINFEIAARFKTAGFSIPYPQRDLYLRNAQEVADAFRGALGEGAGKETEK